MSYRFQLSALVGLFFITLFSNCELEEVPLCPPQGGCSDATWEAHQIDSQLIIQLNPLLKDYDLFGQPDTLYVCQQNPSKRITPADVLNPKPGETINCPQIVDTIIIGRAAVLRDLNLFMYEQDVSVFKDLTVVDSCNCDEDLLLLDVLIPDGVDINSGIARGTSRPKKESEGTIAAAGFNQRIFPAPFNAATLTNAMPTVVHPQDRCYLSLSRKGYTGIVERGQLDSLYATFGDLCDPVVVISDDPPGNNVARVAVIDTGVDPFYHYGSSLQYTIGDSHVLTAELSDLNFSVLNGAVAYGASIPGNVIERNDNCLEDDFFGYDYFHKDNNPADKQGHGSHVAGTILTANAVQGESVRVMPLQFGGFRDKTFSCDLFAGICAISYAVDNGADILNLSWGYYSPYVHYPLFEQLKRARDKGLLMVTSAGNEGLLVDECIHWPSEFSRDSVIGSHLLSVAWMDTIVRGDANSLKLAENSNFGLHVDLAAPGTSIRSALAGTIADTIRLSGTSMAAAVVSRRAAMLRYLQGSSAPVPGDSLKARILRETVKVPFLCIGGRRVLDPDSDPDLLRAIGYEQ